MPYEVLVLRRYTWVLRYLRPESTSRVTTVASGPSRSPTRMAPITLAPAGPPADLSRGLDHRRDELPGDEPAVAGNDRQLRAERGHLGELVFAEGIRGDDVQPISLRRADQGERSAGTAAGVLHHGVAGRQSSIFLGPPDHRLRHPVLHAAGRVLALGFHQDPGAAGRHDPAQFHQRGIADCLQLAGADIGHRSIPSMAR